MECAAYERLGIDYINIASHGVKAHPGKLLNEGIALVLFDKPSTNGCIAALWSIEYGEAITSEDLPFPVTMLWDWDWRAQKVEDAFDRLASRMTPTRTI